MIAFSEAAFNGSDGAFEETLSGNLTSSLDKGLFLIVQHGM